MQSCSCCGIMRPPGFFTALGGRLLCAGCRGAMPTPREMQASREFARAHPEKATDGFLVTDAVAWLDQRERVIEAKGAGDASK